MPLTDEYMLPRRVRTMEPMADLLQAEERMIDRLMAAIAELQVQASINNNRTITKAWLEQLATIVSGAPSHVVEYDSLVIDIVISRNDSSPAGPKTIYDGLDYIIPAHLKYNIIYKYVEAATAIVPMRHGCGMRVKVLPYRPEKVQQAGEVNTSIHIKGHQYLKTSAKGE